MISLERYAWGSRAHAWSRFLSARRGNVPAAMTMVQGHEQWRNDFFPVDVTEAGVQRLLRAHVVSSIEVAPEEGEEEKAPVVYIDFSRLQEFAASESDVAALDVLSSDAAKAFVLFTETLLSRSPDPRRPKTSQFIDLAGVSIQQGLQPGLLRKLHATFEPNYPGEWGPDMRKGEESISKVSD